MGGSQIVKAAVLQHGVSIMPGSASPFQVNHLIPLQNKGFFPTLAGGGAQAGGNSCCRNKKPLVKVYI